MTKTDLSTAEETEAAEVAFRCIHTDSLMKLKCCMNAFTLKNYKSINKVMNFFVLNQFFYIQI